MMGDEGLLVTFGEPRSDTDCQPTYRTRLEYIIFALRRMTRGMEAILRRRRLENLFCWPEDGWSGKRRLRVRRCSLPVRMFHLPCRYSNVHLELLIRCLRFYQKNVRMYEHWQTWHALSSSGL